MPKSCFPVVSIIVAGLLFSSATASDSCTSYIQLYQKDGTNTEAEFGLSVAGVGDVDGDGKADFLIGSPFSDPDGHFNAGSAFLYSGATGSLLYQKDGVGLLEELGLSVAGAGDVNGDGRADFIIGADVRYPYHNGNGSAFVYSGADGSLLFQKDGSSPGDILGYSVAGTGDDNGDGNADFIVGAPLADPNGIEAAGSAFIYSGVDGTLLYQKNGTDTVEQFGVSVAGVGDVNGDGTADFIIGANRSSPYRGGAGSVYLYSGSDGSLLLQKDGAPGVGFGGSVAGIGDLNGDGKADFIVAPFTDTAWTSDGGSAYVYSGLDGSLLFQITGIWSWGYLGTSVSGAGDVNGDGKPDFIVGGIYAGSAFVYSGADGSLLSQINGSSSANFGNSVSGIGDLNGDGKSEVIVGAPASTVDSFAYAGTAFVFSVRPAVKKGDLNNDASLTSTDVILELNAVFLGYPFPGPFCAADINCDGILDLIDAVTIIDAVFLGIPLTCRP